ncbi:TRAP transporter substrate-binding protein [Alicycliphilus denitrificans]|jgi:TRAP-type C4-dicarboxylate transport system substrate-binding protein|uniref:Extracellular solute-binding protein, family 7 n=1 Tax=Alicycliphilus denitrificans (strain DSM 14773 / CIP 107495 / K601) TaxID=596154 RepID=F4GE99_ALIDK|nr:TRAP transporter substrate-binding protein [Alicycliphilus denitrificans]ADU98923.1 Extracellular solute-binding protein, family 7 [Alicycliphilus denitrificans BC]AEB86061.1 Extracellular solute-binding protein, family 7 [Alicycliphilus denitrificans K601]MCC6631872.1 TRAP transporter substrate-binding protein [Gammaproteobacteria bacterium]GAO27026.1 family 7 extracellular solute-binding protein [Alicycliphilus sp. B1]
MARLGPLLGAALLSAAMQAPAAEPAPQAGAALRLRVVGGLAGITQYAQLEAPFWTRDLARLSQGRFDADIVPFDRAGVPGMEMLRLLELGVVPFGTVFMSSLSDRYPQYMAADLPGLNPDFAALRRSLAVFRPYLERALREEHGIELLAVYVYPAQVVFCKQPFDGLADLRGRRVRVSSAAQGDFVSALEAHPRHVPFARLAQSMEAGTSECAITGAMPGNAMGLHMYAAYLYPMPISWGMAIFGANGAAWKALPEELRALLRSELPRLETAIWLSAEQETLQGVDCNVGSPRCTTGRRGRMALVPVRPQDEARREDILRTVVLPRWLQRCGARCADLWNRTMGPARGPAVPAKP